MWGTTAQSSPDTHADSKPDTNAAARKEWQELHARFEMKQHFIAKLVASCLLGAIVGFVLIVLPRWLAGAHTESVFTLVRNNVEGLSGWHLLLLFIAGLVCGLALRPPYSVYSSVCLVGSLPVIAIAEMLKDPTSHNMWPFEFMMYGLLCFVPVAGTFFALFLKRKFRGRQDQ